MDVQRLYLRLKRYRFGRPITQLAKNVFELKYRWSPATSGDLKTILSVEGKISPSECWLLFELASQALSGCIIDIGSYRGRSTVALALGSLTGSQVSVYAIDPHEPFKGAHGGSFGPKDRIAFFRNVLRTGVGEVVCPVDLSSEVIVQGWNREVALLWIDGDHTFEATKRDFECWEPFVVKGGVIGLHDSISPNLGPSQVIAKALSTGRFERIAQVDLTTVLKKL
jgi:hypothetical protein